MHLIIEVRSGKVNCGLPQDPESNDTTGQSYYGFTLVHQLTGNNDAFFPQMYEALVHLSDGKDCKIFTTMTEQFDPIIRLTVNDLQRMFLTVTSVQMAYERLVRIVDKNLQAVPAVG